MRDPLHPPVSRPATDFGPARRAAPPTDVAPASSLPAVARLELICPRPVDHALTFARLWRLATAWKARHPAPAIRLWLRSDLDDPHSYQSLPIDAMVRLPRDDGDAHALLRDGLTGTEGGTEGVTGTDAGCVLLGGDGAWHRALQRLPGARLVHSVPLGFSEPVAETAEAAAAINGFQAALAAQSPRWTRAPGAPWPIRLATERPRFLLHQARFHVGDTLWLTPLLGAIRSRFAGARVTVVGPPVAELVLAGHPGVTVLPYPEHGDAADRGRVLAALDAARPDVALLAFARRPESRWLAAALAARGVDHRINLEYYDPELDPRTCWPAASHEAWFFWSSLPSPTMLRHALDPFLDGGESRPAGRPAVTFPAAAGAAEAAAEACTARGVEPARPLVLLAPGGRSSTRWPPRRFAALAVWLTAALDVTVGLEGSPDEAPLLRAIAARAARRLPPGRAPWWATDPLDVFGALLARSRLLIANDAAPIHLAEAAGTPTLYLAQREKLVHAHPAHPAAWALYDPHANEVAAISVAQATGAVRAMIADGVVELA